MSAPTGKDKSSPSYDGGPTSLSGYLFQAIGALGMTAEVQRDDPADRQGELECFLELVKTGDVTFESYDDAAVSIGVDGPYRLVLVQFKYSLRDRKITPSQLKVILKRFNEGAKLAHFPLPEIGYALVTNRQLTDDTCALCQLAKNDSPIEKITSVQRSILKQLRVIDNMQSDDWIKRLETFAREHGALPDEIESGIERLIAQLVIHSATGCDRSITTQTISKALTGLSEARRLTPKDVYPISMNAIDVYRKTTRMYGEPVRRDLLQDIMDESTRSPVVIVEGRGGSGKTVALWQWAMNVSGSAPNGSGAFVTIQDGDSIRESCVAKTICDWAGFSGEIGPRADDNNSKAYERLVTANPDAQSPLLHMAIDGIDEIRPLAGMRDRIRDVIEWFCRNEAGSLKWPRRTLVISCRDSDTFTNDYPECLPIGMGRDVLNPISFDNFGIPELKQVCQQNLPPKEYQEIVLSLNILSPDTSLSSGQDLLPVGATASPVSREVLDSLLHPLMWRAWIAPLEQEKVQELHDALKGDKPAISRMTKTFLEYFVSKAQRRTRRQTQSPTDRTKEIMGMLQIVAQHVQTLGAVSTYNKKTHWIEPISQSPLYVESQAIELYDEALSGGLILQQRTGYWHWRHSFIQCYLFEIDEE